MSCLRAVLRVKLKHSLNQTVSQPLICYIVNIVQSHLFILVLH